MNPRDDPIVPKLRRPILRRGASYGPKFDENESAPVERGLLGLFFCASIEGQFEHLLGNWANNNPIGLPSKNVGKDPVIGNHDPKTNSYLIPKLKDGDIEINGLQPFVQTLGTCYTFFPSLLALDLIASGVTTMASKFLSRS